MAIGLIPSHLREFFGQLNLCGLSCKYLFSVCHLSFDFAPGGICHAEFTFA